MIVGPKLGLTYKQNFGGENWKIAISADSSELITFKQKWISARLKRLWNRTKTAYKTCVRLWPSNSGC